MAVIDVAGFVADLKSQAIDHGFHVHDERHFVETYSLRQLWEVDLHPEEACAGPIDLHLSLDVDPRAMLGFEDEMMKMEDLDDEPPDAGSRSRSCSRGRCRRSSTRPICSCWRPTSPASAASTSRSRCRRSTRSRASPTPPSAACRSWPASTVDLCRRVHEQRRVGRCQALDRCKHVSLYLLDRANAWLGED